MNEQGHYAVVNGLELYYETHGAGDQKVPLVLLHGGVGGIEMFGPNLPAFARTHRVIAVDLPNHGRSGDVDGALRHHTMADSIAALLAQLGVEKVDLLGYSLGGGVALQLIIRHPRLLRKLVVVSSPFRRDAFYPEILAIFDQMGASFGAMMKQSPMAKLYPKRDWEQLFDKMGDLQRQDFDWSREVAQIRAPMMLIFADADTYRPEHVIEFYKLIGGGQRDAGVDGSQRSPNQLAIIPGTTHYSLLNTTTVADMVEKFLAR